MKVAICVKRLDSVKRLDICVKRLDICVKRLDICVKRLDICVKRLDICVKRLDSALHTHRESAQKCESRDFHTSVKVAICVRLDNTLQHTATQRDMCEAHR